MTRTATSLLRDFFVTPARTEPVERAAVVPPVVAVLGDARGAPALGCAAALALARAGGSDHAVACVWPGAVARATRFPATRSARRAAARATGRGLDAEATGRLVRVRLPAAPTEAVAAAQRAVAALECPTAVALAGPRSEDLDMLLALVDAVILSRRESDPPALTRLAEASLANLGVQVIACDLALSRVAALLATSGLSVGPAAGTALAAATERARRGTELSHSRVVS